MKKPDPNPLEVQLKTARGKICSLSGLGQRLIDVAADAGCPLDTRCGGHGICEGCLVQLQRGKFLVEDEVLELGPESAPLQVKACRVQILGGELIVEIPRSSLVTLEGRIDDQFQIGAFRHAPLIRKTLIELPPADMEENSSDWTRIESALQAAHPGPAWAIGLRVLRKLPAALPPPDQAARLCVTAARLGETWQVVQVEAGDSRARNYGLAVDIGTTTVAAALVDLNAAEVIARASMYNQQITRADDVASRISCCIQPGGCEELNQLIVRKTLNKLIVKAGKDAGVKPEEITRAAIAGNTVMTHLFLGINPERMGCLPFHPVISHPPPQRAGDLGLLIHPEGWVDLVPAVAGYVGGDIVADLYVAQMHRRSGSTLLIDIGTNGEMVLARDGQLTACATAAGPAFEGAGMRHGCRATEGAIERIRLNEALEVDLGLIGSASNPIGLCGSAIIDFIAEGLRVGVINRMGRFDVDRMKAAGCWMETEGRNAFLLHPGDEEPIFICEADLAQVLKAKAAIYAGVKMLLRVCDCRFDELDRVVLAGGFARHICIPHAMAMGLLPALPEARYEVIGNGSLAGAFLSLVDENAPAALSAIAHLPEVIELNLQEGFEGAYVDAMALPHLDPDEFSSLN